MKKNTRTLNSLSQELQVLNFQQANIIKGGDDKRPPTPGGTGGNVPPPPPGPLPNCVFNPIF